MKGEPDGVLSLEKLVECIRSPKRYQQDMAAASHELLRAALVNAKEAHAGAEQRIGVFHDEWKKTLAELATAKAECARLTRENDAMRLHSNAQARSLLAQDSAIARERAMRECFDAVLKASETTYHLEQDYGPLIARAKALIAGTADVSSSCPSCSKMREALERSRQQIERVRACKDRSTEETELALLGILAVLEHALDPKRAKHPETRCGGEGYIPTKRYERDYPAMKCCPGCPDCTKAHPVSRVGESLAKGDH